ncbi:hypothetical protein EJB05_42063, partial [Eragrostis curvula]
MDSSSPSSVLVLDPAKCRLLSVNEKREFVRELLKSPDSALERMEKWTRREIVEVLCVDLGRDIKYSALTKHRLLDHLFKVVNGKMRRQKKHVEKKSSPDLDANNHSPCKRKRINNSPLPPPDLRALTNNDYLCQNSACRATLNLEDKFCRRCSCCICFKYDDNKDPSLWLVCTSVESAQEDSCGLSCHLECAFKDERSGILQSGQSKKLDGGYYCTHCGKQNDLLGCWKKQLLIAKNARRLDVLCYRIFLSHKILISTEKYLILHTIVDAAMKKLEAEVGPITDTREVGHGIVGRLAVCVEVQKLCACALETLHSMFSSGLTTDSKIQRSCMAHCDEPTCKSQNAKLGDLGESEVAGLKKSPRVLIPALHEEQERPRSGAQSALLSSLLKLMAQKQVILKQSMALLVPDPETVPLEHSGNKLVSAPENSVSLLGAIPRGTENCKRVSGKSFEEANPGIHVPQNGCLEDEIDPENLSCKATLGRSEDSGDKDGHSEPSSTVKISLHMDSSNLILNSRGNLQNLSADSVQMENESGAQTENVFTCPQLKHGSLVPITKINGASAPSLKSKSDYHILQTGPSKPETELGNSSNKSSCGKLLDIGKKDESSKTSYEYCIKVIRWLECEGHIETNFRVKFLTWLCLRASAHERRTVNVFVDNLIDDPASLAGQLADAFSDAIYSRRPHPAPSRFCMRLWH